MNTYKYEGRRGWDFFKYLKCDYIKDGIKIELDEVVKYLNNLWKNHFPIGVFTLEEGDYHDIINIIDGKKRLYILSQLYVENKLGIVYDAKTSTFSYGTVNEKEYIYDAHNIYDTFKLIPILNSIENDENLSKYNKKIIYEDLQRCNSYFQCLNFETCVVYFGSDNIFERDELYKYLNK